MQVAEESVATCDMAWPAIGIVLDHPFTKVPAQSALAAARAEAMRKDGARARKAMAPQPHALPKGLRVGRGRRGGQQ